MKIQAGENAFAQRGIRLLMVIVDDLHKSGYGSIVAGAL
jgi:hypothetical protein